MVRIMSSRTTVELLFSFVGLLSCVSCVGRADYNLPLSALLCWCFFSVPQKRRARQQRVMLLFVALSVVTDMTYVIYWSTKWFSKEWLALSHGTTAIHVTVILFAGLETVLKCVALLVLVAPDYVHQATSHLSPSCWKEDHHPAWSSSSSPPPPATALPSDWTVFFPQKRQRTDRPNASVGDDDGSSISSSTTTYERLPYRTLAEPHQVAYAVPPM